MQFNQSNLIGRLKYAFLMLVLFVSCIRCVRQEETNPLSHSPTPEQSIALTPNTVKATATALPTLTVDVANTATPEYAIGCGESHENTHQITGETVSWLLWANTGSYLYYRLKGSDEYWQFDPNDGTVIPIPEEQLVVIAKSPVTISLTIPDSVPEHRRSIAPTGNKAIFVEERFLSPTPTPSGGEGEGMDVQYDLFTLTNESPTPVYLGRIDGSVDSFQWLPDEHEALILTSPRQPGTASLWVTNLDKHELRPLFLVEAGKDEALFKALSPEGNMILYQQSSSLYLYNMRTGATQNVVVPPILGRGYYWFLSETQLLVVNDFDQPLDFKMAIYDSQSEQLRQISDRILHIHSIELSPDYKYLAVRWAETLALYIFPLCYDN